MCLHHRTLPSPPLPKPTHEQQPRRRLHLLPPRHARRPPPPHHHRHRRIERADVLPHDVRRRQRVQLDGALPARLPRHERRQPVPRAVVERDVVRVGRDPRGVERDQGVDGRSRLVRRRALFLGGSGSGTESGG